MTLFLVSIAAFFSTLLGGVFALRYRDKLHLILGFSAGAVIAVAFFDLIPEALELGAGAYEPGTITSFMALGFVIYLLLDRFFALHCHDDEHMHDPHHGRGALGAGSLSVHSFLDGVAIGLAFQVSTAVGAVVAAAVLVHDFSDGINTVNMILKSGGKKASALRFLMLDAAAPVTGVASTLFFTIPAGTLSLLLAVFAGFFLYIGASDLLPESHHRHPRALTTIMTVAGIITLYIAIKIAGA